MSKSVSERRNAVGKAEIQRQHRVMEILRNAVRKSAMTQAHKSMFDLLLCAYFQGSTTHRGENAVDAFTTEAIKRGFIERAPLDRIDFSCPVKLYAMVQHDERHLAGMAGAEPFTLPKAKKILSMLPWPFALERDGNMQAVCTDAEGRELVTAWFSVGRFQELLEITPEFQATEPDIQRVKDVVEAWKAAGADIVELSAVQTARKRWIK